MDVQARRVITVLPADRLDLLRRYGEPKLRERRHQVVLAEEPILLKASEYAAHFRFGRP